MKETRKIAYELKKKMSEVDMEIKKKLQEELKRKASECNKEANKNWEDNKKFQATIISLDEETVYIELEVGRWDSQRFYTVAVRRDGYEYIDMSGKPTSISDNILNYFIMPLLFPEA